MQQLRSPLALFSLSQNGTWLEQNCSCLYRTRKENEPLGFMKEGVEVVKKMFWHLFDTVAHIH